MLDKEETGEFALRAWANMMVTGAKLAYIRNNCGDRVVEDIEQLCGDMNRNITAFAQSSKVERGSNRSTAITRSLWLYQDVGCQPPLNVE